MLKVKEERTNFNQLVMQASIQRTIAEVEQLEKSDRETLELKLKTNELIVQMEKAREAGDEATRREIRNVIVVENLRLVTQVLKKYGYFSQDKFQNGCVGLLKAAETFDSSKGVPFSNYACACIETEIRLTFKRMNRAFEGKKQGFLDSLDAPMRLVNGDEVDRYETIPDPYSEQELDALINEAEVDTLFYDIIIPCIEEYGVRAKDIDMALWRQLEIQYFVELSMEHSQRQRITLTHMAKMLGTTTQNMRVRHKKVLELIRARCRAFGYDVVVSPNGRSRIVKNEVEAVRKLNTKIKNRNSKR